MQTLPSAVEGKKFHCTSAVYNGTPESWIKLKWPRPKPWLGTPHFQNSFHLSDFKFQTFVCPHDVQVNHEGQLGKLLFTVMGLDVGWTCLWSVLSGKGVQGFICNGGDTLSQRSQIKGVRPNPYATGVPKSQAGIIISPMSTNGLTIGYRIDVVCLISTLSTILQHCTHTMKPSDVLQHDNDTVRDVSRRQSCHLSTPSQPRVPPVQTY